MLEQGRQLLEQSREDQRVQVEDGRTDFQIRFRRPLPLSGRDFVGYVDGVGWADGIRCLIKWKTSSQSYPTDFPRLLELDPQLVCYSWAARCQNVCLVNFVRKKAQEIQYLHARIRKRQWRSFERSLDLLVSEMEARHCIHDFLPRYKSDRKSGSAGL